MANTKKFFRDVDNGFFNNSELIEKFDYLSNGQDLFRLEILLIDLKQFIQEKLNYLILSYKPLMTKDQMNEMVDTMIKIELHQELLEILKEDRRRTPEESKEHHINTELYNLRVAAALLESLIENIKESTNSKKKIDLFYPKVGALFAQGFIRKEGVLYFYKDLPFVSSGKLSTYIQDEILSTKSSVRQYIDGTLSEGTAEKDFYNSFTMMKKIIEYCDSNNLSITDDFKKIYKNLKNPH